MEVDSLEAIEELVRHGLGVSIVPDSGRADALHRVPFGDPQAIRRLVLVTRHRPARARLIDALMDALTSRS